MVSGKPIHKLSGESFNMVPKNNTSYARGHFISSDYKQLCFDRCEAVVTTVAGAVGICPEVVDITQLLHTG